ATKLRIWFDATPIVYVKERLPTPFLFPPSLAGSTVSHLARFVAGWATITRRNFAWPPPSTSSTAKSWGEKSRAVTNFGYPKNAKTEKKKKTTRAGNHGIHRPAAQVSGMKIVSGFICFF